MIIGINAKWRIKTDPLNFMLQRYGGERKENAGGTSPIWHTQYYFDDAWAMLRYMVKHEIKAIEGEWDAGALDTLFPKLHDIQQLVELYRERLEPITPMVVSAVKADKGDVGSKDTGQQDNGAVGAANSEAA